MSIEAVLGKITTHNKDVIGCIARQDNEMVHNLDGAYEMIDADALIEQAENMVMLTETLTEDEEDELSSIFVEQENHGLVIRKSDGILLTVITHPMGRAGYKKMQVGLNLFVKPLTKAFEEIAVLTAASTAAPVTAAPREALVAEREPVIERAPEAAPAPEPVAEEPAKPRKRRFYRGIEYFD